MPHTIAAAYIRVSTDDQTEYSPDAQLAAIQRYADANGLLLDPSHIYRDEGISGRSASKRPGFQSMIAAAKRKDHPFDVILVHKLDRFSRSREDSVVYKSMLQRECNVRVISISEPLGDDKMSIIIEPLLEAMAEYYSVNLSEEVKKGMTQKALSGGLQATPSFGYRVENNILVPDPATAPYVVEFFSRFAAGQGLFPIAKWANSIGLRTRRGNAFENRTIEYILRNPVYIGKLRWNPKGRTRRDFFNPNIILAGAKHEPLISQELWDAVQQRLDDMKRRHPYKGKPEGVSRKHWLCGILRCASCGGTLIYAKYKYGSYFKCNNFVRGRCRCSQHTSVSLLEDAVLSQLSADALPGSAIRYRAVAQPSSSASSQQIARSIAALERRLARLRDAYLAGVDSLDDYKRGKESIEEQISALRSDLSSVAPSVSSHADATSQLRAAVRSVLSVLSSDSASTEEKHSAASNIIESIKYSRDDNSLSVVYRASF